MADTLIVNFNDKASRAFLYDSLKRLRGTYRIEMCKHRKRRSDRQNRFYWPCFVKPLADFMREQGEPISENDAHEMLKFRFLRKSYVDQKTGEEVEYAGSTTTLSRTEFNEYLDLCAVWLNDMFGFIMPDPSDYHEKEST